jgi:hypothetical protein
MRLLITNDDGIDSALLHALVGTLRAAGHDLYLAAPKQEQSWVGASKSRLGNPSIGFMYPCCIWRQCVLTSVFSTTPIFQLADSFGIGPNFSSSCHQAIRSGSLIGSRGLRSSANRFEPQITERAERARMRRLHGKYKGWLRGV